MSDAIKDQATSASTNSGMESKPQSLRYFLNETSAFVRIVEVLANRGPLTEADVAQTVSMAEELASLGTYHALSITDNSGGYPKIAPEALGLMFQERKQDVIIHLSCKDMNRNGLESRAWSIASAGFENVLCLSGDCPAVGYRGVLPKPVFDMDAVALLEMLTQMNQGFRIPNPRRGEAPTLPPTQFFLGAAVSPFKQHERELLPQYFKLTRKIASGADFIITQTGYDSRKFDELLKYMALKELRVPVIANVYVLTVALARYFNRGTVAGVVVSDELKALAEQQSRSKDRGKKFFHEFAAKQIAVARSLGYRGAYLSGHMTPEECHAIFKLAKSFSPEDCRAFAREIQFPQPGEFYLFEPDPDTGLRSNELNRAYVASKTPAERSRLRANTSLDYKFSRLVHANVFENKTTGFSAAKRFYSWIDKSPAAKHFFHVLEQMTKVPMFECRDCGDCSLTEIAYLCPESQCAKNQRNGPCGGSHQGICETGEKPCIWARAYERLEAYGEEESMLNLSTILKNCDLEGTSGWANYFLGRDHRAMSTEEPAEKPEALTT